MANKQMTNKELMLNEKLYFPADDELRKDFLKARKLQREINLTNENEIDKRTELFRELLGSTPEEFYIETPFRCDYGMNIFIGKDFYANYDTIILDVAKVIIGDNVMFGPRVSIYTASHPISFEERNIGLEYGKSIKIGNNVWIGGSTVINPGVTIGDNSIIGSGSVVTKNIGENVIAAGNPCRVIREINDEDKKRWENEVKLYRETIKR